MSNDYSDYIRKPDDDDGQLSRLVNLAHKQIEAESLVTKCEEDLDQAKKALQQISWRDIPELMEEAGSDKLGLTNGLEIEIKEEVRASIPKDNKGKAMVWLRENRHGKLIKNTVKLTFSKGEDELAKKLIDLIEKEEFEYDQKEDVHNATLKAFVKEKLKKGEELPEELFSVFRQKISTINTPK